MNSQLVDQLRRAASEAWSKERQFERPDTSASDLLTEAADEIDDANVKVEATELLCKLYFEIAAEVVGEDEVRRRRDAALPNGR